MTRTKATRLVSAIPGRDLRNRTGIRGNRAAGKVVAADGRKRAIISGDVRTKQTLHSRVRYVYRRHIVILTRSKSRSKSVKHLTANCIEAFDISFSRLVLAPGPRLAVHFA